MSDPRRTGIKWRAWTLAMATRFAKKFEFSVRPRGYHIGMTGGVLYHGSSAKDLDLIVYPHRKVIARPFRTDEIHEVLIELGANLMADSGRVRDIWQRLDPSKSPDAKTVEVWEYDDRRVDLFYLE